MSETYSPCSCGSKTFIKRTQVRGIWTSIITVREGESPEIEGCGDSVRNIREPKFIRCDECGKRHPNPQFGQDTW